jgi:hypothetical protein
MSADVLKWISHPLKKSRKRTAFLILALFAIWSLVFWATAYSWGFLFLAVVILMGSMSPFFFPTKYELTQDRVKVRFLAVKKDKAWTEFRSYYPDKNGVFISPFAKPSRIENYRGLYLRYEGNGKEVLDFVKSKINFQIQSSQSTETVKGK